MMNAEEWKRNLNLDFLPDEEEVVALNAAAIFDREKPPERAKGQYVRTTHAEMQETHRQLNPK